MKRTTLACLAALLLLAPALPAQAPKVGDWYKETSDLGFQVRVPDDYELIPPDPNEGNTIAKFDPKTNKSVQLGPENRMDLHVWLARFDQELSPEAKAERKVRSKDLAAYVKREVFSKAQEVSKKDVEVNKLPATEYVFAGKLGDEEIKVYALVVKLKPATHVAWIGIGVGGKKWTKYESAYEQMAKSFKLAEVKEDAAAAPQGTTYRDKRRSELMRDVAKTNGEWKLYETPRYFIISNYDDKPFLDSLKERLEAIRDIYERDYPYEKMQEIKAAAATARTGSGAGDPEKDKTAPPETPGLDPREASLGSLVRVCKSEEQYHSYGGPDGSAGYWNSGAKELVLYNDRDGGKGNTWSVLNHEAFHQYIYYLYGNLAPHSWYNEGTGDFYSGWEYGKNKKFTLTKFAWRKDLIAQSIREGKTVPLVEFTKFTQPQYYSKNEKYGTDIGIHYAQGWSFIYFLRTGKKNNAKGWNPAWDNILEIYFRTLGSTNDLEQAVNQAFDGVDWDALEKAWADYTK